MIAVSRRIDRRVPGAMSRPEWTGTVVRRPSGWLQDVVAAMDASEDEARLLQCFDYPAAARSMRSQSQRRNRQRELLRVRRASHPADQ